MVGISLVGGMVALFGGTALAADSAKVSDSTVVTEAADVPVHKALTERKSAGTSEVSQTSAESTQVESKGDTAVVLDKPAVSEPKLSSGSLAQKPSSSAPAVVTNVAGATVVAKPVVAAVSDDTATPKLTADLVRPPSATVAVNEVAVPVPSAPAAVSTTPAMTVVVQDKTLFIQAPITAHVMLPVDLAENTPSAPVGTKTPVPAHSNGLLSALTVGLVSTLSSRIVVPNLTSSAIVMTNAVARLLLVGALALLGLSFGAWVRRSGYVGAARSDVAGAGFQLEQSFSLGYESISSIPHSPFLFVPKLAVLGGAA